MRQALLEAPRGDLQLQKQRIDPAALKDAIEEIEMHLRYGVPAITRIGWIASVLLALILWRVW